MTPTPTQLGSQLRAERLARGLSQEALARQARVSRERCLIPLEAGRQTPEPTSLARIAVALGRPWDWLGAAEALKNVPEGRGRELLAARLMRGWSHSDLSARSGVGRLTISKLERGQRAGQPRTWADLQRALDATPPLEACVPAGSTV